MASLNKVQIIGALGADPETRFMPDGTAVTNFSVATSENWKDKASGQKQEKTTWHKIVVWRQLAELCGKYLGKGSKVYVEGKLQNRSWEKDGVKQYATEIVASDIQFLSPRQDPAQAQQYQAPEPQSNNVDDDIPF